METSRKFIGLKDIIFVTLLTALCIVLLTIIVMPFALNIQLMLWCVPFLDMLFIGPIYTLACARAPRIGTHFLITFLLSVYYYLTNGMIVISLMILLVGLISELILLKGGYYSLVRRTIALALLGLSVMLAPVALIYMTQESLIETMLASGLTLSYIETMIAAYAPINIAIGAALSVVGSILGCLIGTKLLKKHFQPAGITDAQTS